MSVMPPAGSHQAALDRLRKAWERNGIPWNLENAELTLRRHAQMGIDGGTHLGSARLGDAQARRPRRSARSEPSADLSRTVMAYALRWESEALALDTAGEPLLVRIRRSALDEHLATRPAVAVLVSHEGGSVGRLTACRTDDTGLLVTVEFDASPAGQRALDRVRGGEYRCFSCRLHPGQAEFTGKYRDGLAVHDVDQAELVDVGPTDDPADEQARILTIGGLDARDVWPSSTGHVDLLEALEEATGLRLEDVREAARRERYNAEQRLQETVRRIDVCRSMLQKSRRRAALLYHEWRATHVGATYELFRAADHEADSHLEALSEMLCHDRSLIVEQCRGITPKVDIIAECLR